jgi:hypothetical protein
MWPWPSVRATHDHADPRLRYSVAAGRAVAVAADGDDGRPLVAAVGDDGDRLLVWDVVADAVTALRCPTCIAWRSGTLWR